MLGGLGTFAAWIVVMALNPRTLAVGVGWMVFGIAVYVLYRRNQGLPLTETVKVVTAGAARGRGDRVPQRPGRLRGRPAVLRGDGRDRGQARLQAPPRDPHPLDDHRADQPAARRRRCPSQESEAQSKIEQAKLIGGLRVTGHVERVRPGQAGYSIAEEAREIKAAAIVVGLRYRNGKPLYDKTLQTVLAERPCRVIVVSDPRQPTALPQPRRPPRISDDGLARADLPRLGPGPLGRHSSALGVAILVTTLAAGGGPLSVGHRCSASPSSRSAPAGSSSRRG